MIGSLRPPFTWKLLKTVRKGAGGRIASVRGVSSLSSVLVRGTARFVTSPLRDLPDFVIIGAQKAGSTSLHHYLAQHPQIITGMSRKEQQFFDRNYHRGTLWYRTNFPIRGLNERRSRRNGKQRLIGESTPNYIFHPLVPQRMASLLPDAKLIAILRNPVDRAISHYYHNVRKGFEHLDMEEAFLKEEVRLAGERERMLNDESYRGVPYLRFSYLSRGRYAEQLECWLQCYPPERLLVLRSEDLFSVPQETIERVFTFLGCAPYRINVERKYNQFPHPGVEGRIGRWLLEYFEPHNARLSTVLGFDPAWD
jgi:hypothetical protein